MLTEHFTQSAGLENAWSDAVEGLRLRIYPEAFLESHGIKVKAREFEEPAHLLSTKSASKDRTSDWTLNNM